MRQSDDEIDRIYRREIERGLAPRRGQLSRLWVGGIARAVGSLVIIGGVVGVGTVALLNHGAASSAGTTAPATGGASASAAVTPTPVPWAALGVPPSPSALPQAPACSAGDVSVSALTFAGLGLGTAYYKGTATLVAPTHAACDLPSTLTANFHDAQGALLAIPETSGSSSASATIPLGSGQTATIEVLIAGWCAVPSPATVTFILPGGANITTEVAASPMPSAPPCAGESASYAVMISGPAVSTATPSASSAVGDLGVSIVASAQAIPGEPYAYVIALTNTGSTVVDLTPCPAYDEGVKGAVPADYSYQLNCQYASPIAPGSSEAFSMQIGIPRSEPPGSMILSWGLRGTAIVANATVDVS